MSQSCRHRWEDHSSTVEQCAGCGLMRQRLGNRYFPKQARSGRDDLIDIPPCLIFSSTGTWWSRG